jgi:hypothetical protein
MARAGAVLVIGGFMEPSILDRVSVTKADRDFQREGPHAYRASAHPGMTQ